jgi:DNA-binding winged helix-turn-helix (wHTH) protein
MNVRFGEFRLDSETRELFRDDAEVHLSPKAFELLLRLLEARPKALSKAELMERLWPGTFVTDANLSVLVAEIRHALSDQPGQSRFLRTVHRFGYAFCGMVISLPASAVHPTSGPTYWLVTGTHRIHLADGETVVGRDPHAPVWCDQPGVSRRHARIVIRDAEATIEDLGSKNGTYVRGARVATATSLRDGDEIRIGTATFTVRVLRAASTTESASISGAIAPSS